MLFKVYMKLLREVILGFEFECHQYTDDTQLYFFYQVPKGLLKFWGAVWMQLECG